MKSYHLIITFLILGLFIWMLGKVNNDLFSKIIGILTILFAFIVNALDAFKLI